MLIEIYGTSWCNACKDAMEFCKNNGIEFRYVDVDDTINLKSLEERLGSKVRSVPQIFSDGTHLSGGTAELYKGEGKV
jgi:glutaredoxin